jgi:DNA modification methylase
MSGAFRVSSNLSTVAENRGPRRRSLPPGLKRKDLIGIPWMVAFALRADGWYLRSEIIWAKTSCMPEAVTDRPTKAHETIFLLSKSPRYFYDHEAIREPDAGQDHPREILDGQLSLEPSNGLMAAHGGLRTAEGRAGQGRNKRTVWTVGPQPYAGAHFATFPPKLIEPCILAGSRKGDTVLDPFSGAGTTGMVALRHLRSYVGIELNPAFALLARERIVDDAPLLNSVGMVA